MTHKFEYSQIENVKIRGVLYFISIEGKEVSSVTGKIETMNKNYILHHKQEGTTLVIWFEKPWWAFFSISTKNKLIMEIPLSTNITIENSSGTVEVKNINADYVGVKTSSGSIIAENITADQNFSSTSGRIFLRHSFSSHEIPFHATTGDIVIEGMEADCLVMTSSGKISLNNTRGNKVLKSTSGSIDLFSSIGTIESRSSSGRQTYKDQNGNIKVHTSSGRIVLKGYKGALALNTTSGSINGKDVTLTGDSSFTTTSGSISIDYTNEDKDFTFNLKSNSGSLKAGSISLKKKLNTGHGSILITGKSSSGSQVYE